MGTGSDFDVYPDRTKVAFDHGRGASFAGAFGRHGAAQSTSFGEVPMPDATLVDVTLTTEALGPIVPFRLPASAFNGRTARGRARRS
jgi:hypothetical protein